MRHFYPRLNLIVIVSVVCGCTSTIQAPQPDPVAQASVGVAGIVAHTESAERHVRRAIPHANPTGKVYLTAASDEHAEVLANVAHTYDVLKGAQQQVATLADSITQGQAAYSKLESRWYVRWGRRIERLLWIIGITWLVLGVASVAFGLGNPLSWTWRIGKELTRLLPVMNPFSWIRDWLLARRKAADHG
jgi:hypothetical protein